MTIPGRHYSFDVIVLMEYKKIYKGFVHNVSQYILFRITLAHHQCKCQSSYKWFSLLLLMYLQEESFL